MNIHERVRKIRQESSLTLVELSNLVGVPDRTISNYERGERKPSVEYLALLAEKLGANPEWLILGTGEMFTADSNKKFPSDLPASVCPSDFKYIPMCDIKAAAGNGSIINNENIVDYLAFKKDWLNTHIMSPINQLLIFTAKGDSMEPTIKDGDMLMLDTSEKSLKQDGIYVLRIGEGLVVKRVQCLPNNRFQVISDNTNYDAFFIDLKTDQDVGIIGKVVWHGRHVGSLG